MRMEEDKQEHDEKECLTEQFTGINDGDKHKVVYKWYNINTAMVSAKLSYVFETGRRFGYEPNLVLFLTSIGLNKGQAGLIHGFRMIGMIFGGMFWSMLADKSHRHRIIVTIMCIASILLITAQPFVSIYYGNHQTNRCPSPAIVHPNYLNATSNQTIAQTHDNYDSKNLKRLFYALIFLNVAISFAEGNSVGFVDTGAIRKCQLSTDKRPILFGRQKMYSAVGGAIGIVASNFVIDYFPTTGITCYSGIFVVYIIYTILFGISMCILYTGLTFKEEKCERSLPRQSKNNENEEEMKALVFQKNVEIAFTTDQDKKQAYQKILFKTLMQFDTQFFYTTTFMSGLQYSQFTAFLFVYLRELHAPTILLTLSIVVSAVTSMAGFEFSQAIINRLGGCWRTIAFTFFVYFIRYLGISLIQNPWLVLIFQPMHAISAALFVCAGLEYLKDTSPVAIITTQVVLFNVLHYGLGTIVGSSISGIIYEKFGGKTLFMSTSFLAVFWGVVVVLYIVWKERKSVDEKTDSKS